MRFAAAAERLTGLADFDRPLPDGPASLLPVFADDRLRPRLAPSETARPAAVLVLLYPDPDGEARLVLTERVTYDGLHSGEVSFPGGKADQGDADAAATALREAHEEVSLDAIAAGVETTGTLEDVFIPVSDFRITPVVALAAREPALVANPDEVARLLTPPVEVFLPSAPIEIVERTVGEWPLRYGGYRVDGLHVWGATARILGRLGALLGAPEAVPDPARAPR